VECRKHQNLVQDVKAFKPGVRVQVSASMPNLTANETLRSAEDFARIVLTVLIELNSPSLESEVKAFRFFLRQVAQWLGHTV